MPEITNDILDHAVTDLEVFDDNHIDMELTPKREVGHMHTTDCGHHHADIHIDQTNTASPDTHGAHQEFEHRHSHGCGHVSHENAHAHVDISHIRSEHCGHLAPNEAHQHIDFAPETHNKVSVHEHVHGANCGHIAYQKAYEHVDHSYEHAAYITSEHVHSIAKDTTIPLGHTELAQINEERYFPPRVAEDAKLLSIAEPNRPIQLPSYETEQYSAVDDAPNSRLKIDQVTAAPAPVSSVAVKTGPKILELSNEIDIPEAIIPEAASVIVPKLDVSASFAVEPEAKAVVCSPVEQCIAPNEASKRLPIPGFIAEETVAVTPTDTKIKNDIQINEPLINTLAEVPTLHSIETNVATGELPVQHIAMIHEQLASLETLLIGLRTATNDSKPDVVNQILDDFVHAGNLFEPAQRRQLLTLLKKGSIPELTKMLEWLWEETHAGLYQEKTFRSFFINPTKDDKFKISILGKVVLQLMGNKFAHELKGYAA